MLCPTPIGNLEDITLRALTELRQADVVLAEDSRRTSILLRHHGIAQVPWSYHDHNERERLPQVLERLGRGERVILVSDAGTPGLADPGFRLVRAAVDAGISVTALPGPNALLPALTLSALPTHAFAFHGFVPRADQARRAALARGLEQGLTSVWYESPRRLVDTLQTLVDLGHASLAAAVARELSKIHEEVCRGTVAELLQHFVEAEPRGEVVLCLAPPVPAPQDLAGALQHVRELCAEGMGPAQAAARVARASGLGKRALYTALLEAEREQPGR